MRSSSLRNLQINIIFLNFKTNDSVELSFCHQLYYIVISFEVFGLFRVQGFFWLILGKTADILVDWRPSYQCLRTLPSYSERPTTWWRNAFGLRVIDYRSVKLGTVVWLMLSVWYDNFCHVLNLVHAQKSYWTRFGHFSMIDSSESPFLSRLEDPSQDRVLSEKCNFCNVLTLFGRTPTSCRPGCLEVLVEHN